MAKLRREPLKLPLLGWLQGRVDELTFQLSQARRCSVGALLPRRGEPHEPPAPVVRVGSSRDKCLLLQSVEDDRDVVRPDSEDLGELPRLLRLGRDPCEQVQGVVLDKRESASSRDALEHLGEVVADDNELLAKRCHQRRGGLA